MLWLIDKLRIRLGGKEYLKSDDGLLIHKLTTTATLANKAVDISAYLLSPEKIIVRF